MTCSRAIALKKEEIEQQRLHRPLGDLRARVRDLPRPRKLEPGHLKPHEPGLTPSPVPGGQLVLPGSGPVLDFGATSPFSIEALVAQELEAKARSAAFRPPLLPLIPELKRREVPLAEPRAPVTAQRPAAQVFRPLLEAAPAVAVVWTDPFFYGGSPDDLQAVRAWTVQRDVETAPVLIRADLIIDPYQLFDTVVRGGDAVVAIVAALSRNQLEDLLGEAAELGLELLVYVTGAAEVDRALAVGARHFTIGSGDLFESADRAAPGMGWLRELGRELPTGAVKVSWGGVRDLETHDVRARAGATALVVGRGYEAVATAWNHRREEQT